MRKPRASLLLITTLGIIIVVGLYAWASQDSPHYAKYKQIQVGMSVEEVQAILGVGTMISQREVPGVVRAVNQSDEDALLEQARLSGGPPPTARHYPTRIKPVVEGNLILKWENYRTGETILIGFKDGKVFEKDFENPNYL